MYDPSPGGMPIYYPHAPPIKQYYQFTGPYQLKSPPKTGHEHEKPTEAPPEPTKAKDSTLIRYSAKSKASDDGGEDHHEESRASEKHSKKKSSKKKDIMEEQHHIDDGDHEERPKKSKKSSKGGKQSGDSSEYKKKCQKCPYINERSLEQHDADYKRIYEKSTDLREKIKNHSPFTEKVLEGLPTSVDALYYHHGYIATGSIEGTVSIWKVSCEKREFKMLTKYKTHDHVVSIKNYEDKIFATGHYDGTAKLWRYKGDIEELGIKSSDSIKELWAVEVREQGAWVVEFNVDLDLFGCGPTKKLEVLFCRLSTGKELYRLKLKHWVTKLDIKSNYSMFIVMDLYLGVWTWKKSGSKKSDKTGDLEGLKRIWKTSQDCTGPSDYMTAGNTYDGEVVTYIDDKVMIFYNVMSKKKIRKIKFEWAWEGTVAVGDKFALVVGSDDSNDIKLLMIELETEKTMAATEFPAIRWWLMNSEAKMVFCRCPCGWIDGFDGSNHKGMAAAYIDKFTGEVKMFWWKSDF